MKISKKNRLILSQLKKLFSARKALNQTSRDHYLQCKQSMCLSTPSSKPRNSCNNPKNQKKQTRKKTKIIQNNLKNKLRKIVFKIHHRRRFRSSINTTPYWEPRFLETASMKLCLMDYSKGKEIKNKSEKKLQTF